ncbi:hypothetical protein SZN_25060 [Streptomyces zinciresistens K42]|uniref:Phosphohistidine phosphatase n=1 Tax=Streptomyces zinciresistens K42 TaxID=700597 RepID=G2GHM5_9ACTN|nr:histidine phosphatase family protein [Streptomyces zinciresistens]EGX57009.1 hypothetical protein SZN_25060 [Streptomyces zinciresistens K42]
MSAGAGPRRRLVVLRHAKSAWPEGVADHDRPLAARGRRDAPAAGRILAAAGCLPDLALCSTAVRARSTLELASGPWDTAPEVRHDPRLYTADASEALAAVHEVPPGVGTLLVVGHNPALEDLVLDLAGEGPGSAVDEVRAKFPTAAIAVLTWYGTGWRELRPGTALLTRVMVARGEKP